MPPTASEIDGHDNGEMLCPVPSASGEEHSLGCMEIWGGNGLIADPVSVPGIEAWVSSDPHGEADHGGDVYYVSTCGGGKIARFALADVSGHGASVAELGRTLRKLIRKHINTANASRVARSLNKGFAELKAEGFFATAVLATYFAPTSQFIIVNAGHPRPLWYRADRAEWRLLHAGDISASAENPPIGIIDGLDFEQYTVDLAAGDLIIAYSDALTEARAPGGPMLGESGLLELARLLDVHEEDPAKIGRALLESVAVHRNHVEPEDDQTVIVMRHTATGPRRPTMGEAIRTMGKLMGLLPV